MSIATRLTQSIDKANEDLLINQQESIDSIQVVSDENEDQSLTPSAKQGIEQSSTPNYLFGRQNRLRDSFFSSYYVIGSSSESETEEKQEKLPV